MLFLGVLLLMATGAFTLLLIAENRKGTPEYTATLFDQDVATMSTTAVFLAGLALALLFALAFWMSLSGGGRAYRRMLELRAVRAEARDAAAERDALRDQLESTPNQYDESAEPASSAPPSGTKAIKPAPAKPTSPPTVGPAAMAKAPRDNARSARTAGAQTGGTQAAGTKAVGTKARTTSAGSGTAVPDMSRTDRTRDRFRHMFGH